MSRPQHTRFESWLRGGQTVGHTFEMTLEVLTKLLRFVFLPLAIPCLYLVSRLTDGRSQNAFLQASLAHLFAWFGPPAPQTLVLKDPAGGDHPFRVHTADSDPLVALPAQAFCHSLIGALLIWLGLSVALSIIINRHFFDEGQEKVKERQLRGQVSTEIDDLTLQIETFNDQEARRRGVSFYLAPEIVGVPYPMGAEREHTMIVGAPGSGKSVTLHALIDSIRGMGHRAIIFDHQLEFIRDHYRESTDVILNPFDARSPNWSPFFDAKDSPDWAKLGATIFKDPRSGDPYWVNATRQIFSWTGYQLRQRGETPTLDEFLDLLLGPPTKLREYLEGTPAAAHLAGLEGGGARVASLLSVMAEGVEPLIYLKGSERPFSIKQWVNAPPASPEDGEGFLFLSTPQSHREALKPLLGFWCELAMSAILSRYDDRDPQPTWIILDEFHSAGRIDALADAPQLLRKWGGCVVLGFQQVSQLEDLYGRDKARTLVGQCQTKVILRAGDYDTATLMSEQLGRRVLRRVEENTSYGANSIRDGVGLVPKEDYEPVCLPEDVYNFPALEGMIRVANARPTAPFPVARIKVAITPRAPVAPGFVPKSEDPVKAYLAARLRRGGKGDGSAGAMRTGTPPAGPSPQGAATPRVRSGGRPAARPVVAPPALPFDAAAETSVAAQAQSGHQARLEPEAVGIADDEEAPIAQGREKLPKADDLPTEEARRLQAKAYEDAVRFLQRTAAARAEVDLDRLTVNLQRQETLSVLAPEEDATPQTLLGVQDTATIEDVAQAIAHRGEGLSEAAALIISLALGVDVDSPATPGSERPGDRQMGEVGGKPVDPTPGDPDPAPPGPVFEPHQNISEKTSGPTHEIGLDLNR